MLADATPRFPPGTIHVAVVDPGVGTSRRLVYAEIGGQRYLAPDNGLLSLLAMRETPPSSRGDGKPPLTGCRSRRDTFHGRDILAPVAAHLALRHRSGRAGPASSMRWCMLDWPQPTKSASGIAGEVLYVDSFGNLITNIGRDEIGALGDHARLVIDCGGHAIRGIVPMYGAAMAGELVALFDSQGRLEIAKVGGNAVRASCTSKRVSRLSLLNPD